MLTFKKFLRLTEAAQPERFDDYIKRLQGIGLKALGNGINSFVFKHPTMEHVAVKVFLDDDVGYREYIEFCRANPKNKYATKILDTEDFADERKSKYVTHELGAEWDESRGVDPAYSICFLELLSPISNECFSAFLSKLAGFAEMEGITSLARLGAKGWSAVAKKTDDQDLRDFAEFVLQQLGAGHRLDMGNRKNFMQRGEDFVFVDPFV
jgi:hypothetical protein